MTVYRYCTLLSSLCLLLLTVAPAEESPFIPGKATSVATDPPPSPNGTVPQTTALEENGQAGASHDPAAILRTASDAFAKAVSIEGTDRKQAHQLYQSAILRYEQLIHAGYMNGKLYYNLGNTYYKVGQIGKAILCYKYAGRFSPTDENLLGNLERVRAMRADKISQSEDTSPLRILLFWHYDLSFQCRSALFAIAFFLFWTGMIVRRLWRSKKIPAIWQLSICAGVALLLFLSLYIQPYEQSHRREGVILQKEVIARKGNADTYQPAFLQPLHEGTEFVVCEARPGWLEVRLQDGRRCWLPSSCAGLIEDR